MAASWNAGWYGPELLTDLDRFCHRPLDAVSRARWDATYEAGTAAIRDLSPPTIKTGISFNDLVPQAIIEPYLAPRSHEKPPVAPTRPSFTIITVLRRPETHIRACAISVTRLIERAIAMSIEVAWIVVSEDSEAAAKAVNFGPDEGRVGRTRFVQHTPSDGTYVQLGDIVAGSATDWILLLDSDDEIEPDTIEVLAHYVARFPTCRLMVAAASNIDEIGRHLRFQRHDRPPTNLFHSGAWRYPALRAIRHDLSVALGGLPANFDACDLYGLALRASMNEKILLVPDHLYRHRVFKGKAWDNDNIQVTAKLENVRRGFLRDLTHPKLVPIPVTVSRQVSLRKGLGVIMTDGNDLEALLRTIDSLKLQQPPVEPLLILREVSVAQQIVERFITERLGAAPLILQASDRDCRGDHPLNAAIDYLYENTNAYDFVCFLNEGSILYPFFSDRLCAVVQSTGAGLAYCLAHGRTRDGTGVLRGALPLAFIVLNDLIPIDALIMTTATLRARDLRFSAAAGSGYGWAYLLDALKAGITIAHLPEVHCESRAIEGYDLLASGELYQVRTCDVRFGAHAKSAPNHLGAVWLLQAVAQASLDQINMVRPSDLRDLRALWATLEPTS